MKCAHCLAELPGQSVYCLRCGTPVPGTETLQMPAASPFAQHTAARNQRVLIAVVVLLALFAAGLSAMMVRGQIAQRSAGGSGSKMVQAPGAGPGGTALVQAPGQNDASNLVQAPGSGTKTNIVSADAPPVPSDVSDYLAFLRQIEASKQKLMHRELGDLLVQMGNAKSLQGTIDENQYNQKFADMNRGLSSMNEDWNQLTVALEQRVPPDSCKELYARYYEHLGKIQASILAVVDAMSKVQSDPSTALHSLSALQGTASTETDAAIAAAEAALSDVCSKYHVPKEFEIRGDPGDASLFH